MVRAGEDADEGGDVGEVEEHGNLEEDIDGDELKKEHCGCIDLMGWGNGGSYACVRWMEVLGTIRSAMRSKPAMDGCDELFTRF